MPTITQERKQRHSNPSPDRYQPVETLVRQSAPQFSMSPKHASKTQSKVTTNKTLQQTYLGPGAYDPKLTKSSKLISLSGRHPVLTKEDMPGPDQYRPKNGIGESKFNSFTFNSPLNQPVRAIGPGPAGYQMQPTSEALELSINRYSRYPSQLLPVQPAPNCYSPRLPSSAKQISLKSRFELTKPEPTPGPGHYKVNHVNEHTFTFGERTEITQRPQSPGPIYYPETKVEVPLLSIREKFPKPQLENCSPSPDRYSPTRPVSSLGTSLASRVEYKHFEQKPGPNEFSLENYQKTRPASPQFSLQSKHYPVIKDNEYPAPNVYKDVQKRSSSPTLSMKFRVPLVKNHQYDTPGPGEYNVRRDKVDKYQAYRAKSPSKAVV